MLDRFLERLPAEPRRTLVLLGVIALAAALFRFPGLGYPGEEYFDEVYHAKTALQYLRGEPPTEWVHPPTAKLLIAVGVALFGYAPWAWRLAPALAGTLLAPVFFLLARRVLATRARGAPRHAAPPPRRRLPRAEPRGDDQRLRRALPAAVRAPAACARRARSGSASGRWRRRASPWGSRSRRGGRACSPGASSASCSWPCAARGPSAGASSRSARSPSRSSPPASTC